MRVLLCNLRTGLYFQSLESWTTEAESAQDFGSSLKAALFALDNNIDGAEVYLDFGDHEYNVHLPVQGRLKAA
jgi:hypothetical protein